MGRVLRKPGFDDGVRLNRGRGLSRSAPSLPRAREVNIGYEDRSEPGSTLQWDDVVDVICTGSGMGGLAVAIAADDMGESVFVADASRTPGLPGGSLSGIDSLHRRLGVDVVDGDTDQYLRALTDDLGPVSSFPWDLSLPVRAVTDVVPDNGGRRTIETFVGARLRDWAFRCVASPYGVVHTHVDDRHTTTMRCSSGDAVEVAVIGSYQPDPAQGASALGGWLHTQADDRGIEVHGDSPLQRLVFEDGRVVGAAISTPTGVRTVRARRGVVVATGGYPPDTIWPVEAVASSEPLQVAMVTRNASRFARLELLTAAEAAAR
jgi:hypothetical protein